MFAARRFFSPLLASGTVDRAKQTLSLFLTSDVPADLAGMRLNCTCSCQPCLLQSEALPSVEHLSTIRVPPSQQTSMMSQGAQVYPELPSRLRHAVICGSDWFADGKKDRRFRDGGDDCLARHSAHGELQRRLRAEAARRHEALDAAAERSSRRPQAPARRCACSDKLGLAPVAWRHLAVIALAASTLL